MTAETLPAWKIAEFRFNADVLTTDRSLRILTLFREYAANVNHIRSDTYALAVRRVCEIENAIDHPQKDTRIGMVVRAISRTYFEKNGFLR